MGGKKLKYIIGLVIIILAFAYLVWSSFMGSFQFSLTPTEFNTNRAQYIGKIVKLSGVVEPGSISFDQANYIFSLTDGEDKVKVHYKGVVPNTFRDGADVVAGGEFNTELGRLEATQLITKCASKYEGQ